MFVARAFLRLAHASLPENPQANRNVRFGPLAGYLRWIDYRGEEFPNAIRIEHHKTGARVLHPLEETIDGKTAKFYEDVEAVLVELPRRGIPMIFREIAAPRDQKEQKTIHKPFSFSGFQKIVQRLRAQIGLPRTFTLDACRHGG